MVKEWVVDSGHQCMSIFVFFPLFDYKNTTHSSFSSFKGFFLSNDNCLFLLREPCKKPTPLLPPQSSTNCLFNKLWNFWFFQNKLNFYSIILSKNQPVIYKYIITYASISIIYIILNIIYIYIYISFMNLCMLLILKYFL